MTVDQVMDAWQVSEHQRALLLAHPDAAHQVVTINDAVCRIFELDQDRATSWIRKPNRAFDNRSALDLMLVGDIEHVRKHVMYHVYSA